MADWKKRQEIPDPQVLDAARQYEAARRILDAAAQPGTGVVLPLINTAAFAIELYLKSLSAEVVHEADESFPGMSRVYAQPAVTNAKGHGLAGLLDKIDDDIRTALETAYAEMLQPTLENQPALREVLGCIDGAMVASRYPFERGKDVSKYKLDHLMRVPAFLDEFTRTLEPRQRITWQ